MSGSTVQRNIGLSGAIFTLVGYVIGASIFILPGQLAADAGPAVFVSYLIAGALSATAAVIGAALGSAIHVSGAMNVAASQVLAPVVGFLGVRSTLAAVAAAISLVSYGLADYVLYFLPGADRLAVALASTLLFGLLNLTTVQLAVRLQVLMTLGFLVILVGFGVGGVVHADPALLTPFAPMGWGAVFTAAVPAFFSYTGMTVIVEIGGEIKRPARTIPLALLVSFLVIAFCYALVAFAVPALLPMEDLRGMEAPVARAAEAFLPRWVGGVVAVGALLAAATSINGILLIHSRDVLAMARARVLPEFLARRNTQGVPAAAVLLVTGLSVAATLIGGTIREYAVLAVISVMLLQIVSALVVLRLPSALPAALAQAEFRLGTVARWGFSGVTILGSLVFMVFAVADSPRKGIAYLAVLALGAVYYYLRRANLARQGYSIDAVLRSGASAEG